jgi:pentatricopeptide repeat protein
MLKGLSTALLILIGMSLLDHYMANGRYSDAAFAMMRQMRHSFGV